jgi:hypothetical protein
MATTRRALTPLGAILALGGALLPAASALAQLGGAPAARYAAVVVDVEALRAKGLGPFAEALRGDLQAAMRAAFADRIGPGPRLVVRITGVSLNAYAGSDARPGGGRGWGGGMNNDYLEGEALVVGRDGAILQRHPQLSASPASSGGAWYNPASERRRLAALAEHYAGWLRRAL